MWVVVGLAVLLGYVLNELPLDMSADEALIKSFFCMLTASVMSFPGCLRIVGVVVPTGALLIYQTCTARSHTAWWLNASTILVLLLGGMLPMVLNIQNALDVCSDNASITAADFARSMFMSHVVIIVVILAAMTLQLKIPTTLVAKQA
eukprot:GEMP01097742.1.p1 GENE.GEMP01097742.1~~GEMP01097742.1.p1  ORF type:complete len:171 (+),score=35.47 GEMP01097742.1:71-514(+)